MANRLQVIYIEDDELVRRASVQSLQLAGFDVVGFGSVEAAEKAIVGDATGVIVSDIRLPGASGLELLAQCRERTPDVPVVLVTGHGDISMAVQAMRDGAYDFIEKPFAAERLTETVRRALERRALVLENHALRRELAGQGVVAPRIIGRSPAIEQVRRLIANVAPTDASVLINGDTGAGKELIARSLHELSPRRDKPFIAVNCGALPEPMFESEMFGYEPGAFTGAAKRRIGKLEYASGGTLFLDEIESMPLALQVKLLRVLQDGVLERLGSNQPIRVNCRVVAAAKGDMSEHVAAGTFRRDLLYRLNVVTIALPPLAERREDIVPLFEHFMLDAAVRYGRPAPLLTDRQRASLMQRDWPGNVRELRNAADRFVLGVTEGIVGDAGPETDEHAEQSLKERVEQFERAVIAETLNRTGGAVATTADKLHVGKATLYEKMKRYGLSAKGETDR
ncbi:sigma-54 dependent transcriptional regulator [Burkholderia pseudomallei]|uniref:C4-dicarboxylate transport transcriptional regulatory protein n=10 Tax=pseudomallei group TaxID=111527 RepID=Q63XW3_BURPS|nr:MULTISPECIES: sigma-54 dependent transcriptional regulator [Burkholderia]EIF62515.1 C4-dicarboxylate transport transcriptional regulatory protein [Burkholderia pseudomallei 1258a]KGX77114.1 AAA domain family protein [Burkholderia pseudomallei MSHR435]AAU48559.1 C4-dicarboxylate transport transcriptional regulatory protein [Burkholderia mallei ATCC 23344]ABA47899.1 C4-dicarboxylate transport transcriptional regulatory protein [Burkholderia pseudomallei 1710b]ABM50750.1 C4-dicarboxylate trans